MISLPLISPESVHRTLLPNGLTVLLRRDDSAPVVAIVTHVKAGYFDETDDVVGIAHVLEHMFFKGTRTRGVGEISRETKAAGGYLNAGTIYDYTSYYTVLPSSGLSKGLEIQADAYSDSLIEGSELAKELEVIIQEAKRKTDNPTAVTVETLYELLHDRHRMRRWRIGREPGLRALTREALIAFYRNFYRPSTTILAVVGDIDLDDTLRLVERLYGGIADAPVRRSPGPIESDAVGFRYRELAGDVGQTQLAMGWRTQAAMHPDSTLLDLAGTVLGSGRASRLYRAVRERKLASSVSAYNYTPTEVGVFLVTSEGPPERAAEAVRAIWSQLASLRDGGVERDELWRARRLYESRWIRRLETMEGQASYLAEWEALGDWKLGDRYLERLLTASEEQVTAAMRRYLVPDRAAIALYRPAAQPAIASDAEAMRRMLDHAVGEPLPVPPPRLARSSPAASHSAVFEREEGRVRVYRTRHGVPVLLARKRGAPLAHVGVYALGGASEEPAEFAGLTTLLTRTALKGTARRTASQIAEDAELLGGSLSSSAGPESFGWTISVPAVHAVAALELLADVVQHPTLAEQMLDTERALAISELAMIRDDMYRYPLRLLAEAAFPGHPYGVPASGTESSLERIDATRLREWHRTRVLQAPAVIVIVGDLDDAGISGTIAASFDELRVAPATPVPPPAWPTGPVERIESRDKAQTALALAFPAPDRSDDDRFAAHLIASVASGLGGRFFEELRDKQSLAYTVTAFATQRRRAGMFVSYIATSPEKESTARRGLLAEFDKLRSGEVSPRELAQAQEYAVGSHAIRQQSGAAVLSDVLDSWLFGRSLAELDMYEERVRAVTAARMLEVAQRYFDESRRVEGIVRGVGRSV
ncbi:MAG: insulinase family protein [Gemmatimonadota bacterium]|nr:insulinase family protein [Gemmatimonadota bacterium]